MIEQDKVVIEQSDYTRKQIEAGIGWSFGNPDLLLTYIKAYESLGYTVTFYTNLWRRIFSLGIYKIIATKTTNT